MMALGILQLIWFVLVGGLFMGYAMLDGFDLGAGVLHLLYDKKTERRTILNAIGPVWDGNEVWLVVGGGALLAAFPEAYATVFSGFYLPFIFLLFGLIFRGVSIEFRGKLTSTAWCTVWDVGFSLGSITSAFILGMIIGNLGQGIPLDAHHEFIGSPWGFINLYALLVGATTVALFAMHAAIYLVLKTEGDLQARIRRHTPHIIAVFAVMYLITTLTTVLYVPRLTLIIREMPIFYGVALANILVLANIPRLIYRGKDFQAFLFSCLNIALLLLIFGLGMFPNLVPSAPNALNSLTLYNASSSPLTLSILLIVAAMGFPLVLAYTATIYWVFRGKVKLEPHSY